MPNENLYWRMHVITTQVLILSEISSERDKLDLSQKCRRLQSNCDTRFSFWKEEKTSVYLCHASVHIYHHHGWIQRRIAIEDLRPAFAFLFLRPSKCTIPERMPHGRKSLTSYFYCQPYPLPIADELVLLRQTSASSQASIAVTIPGCNFRTPLSPITSCHSKFHIHTRHYHCLRGYKGLSW